MTSRDRVAAALRHEEPDRVPLDLGGSLVTSIAGPAYGALRANLGLPGLGFELLEAADGVARVDRDCMEAMGLDVLPFFASPPDKPRIIRETVEGSWFEDVFGATLFCPTGGCGYNFVAYPLRDSVISAADLDRIRWGELLDPGFYRGLRDRAEALRRDTPYALFAMAPQGHDLLNRWFRVRGMEQGLMDLAEQPLMAEEFFERLTLVICETQRRFLREVGHAIDVHFLADDFGAQTGPLVSPRFLREVILPRWARIVEVVKQGTQAKVFFHSCGAIADLIPDLLAMGVEIINPVQVTCSGMDTGALKRKYGKNLSFWGGGVDTQSVLASSTPLEVREEVRRRVRDLAPGGGFVFTPVHNIMSNVPVENVVAAYDEARRSGAYPLR
jgi:uroporphyrinogen decarboxylase